jgi:two-component system phosphate regulon sensor histidine kinase PhoR
MTRKIFKNIFLVTLISVILSTMFIIFTVYGVFDEGMQNHQKDEALYIVNALNRVSDKEAYLQAVSNTQSRITWIAPDGTVLFDDLTDPAHLDNHLNRPEVQKALSSVSGSSSRYSSTLSEQTVYYALRLEDGSVLRISNTRSSILGLFLSLIGFFALILIGIVIFVALLAKKASRNILKPLNELNLDEPLENDVYEEIAPLLRRIDKQNALIREQIHNITARQRKFDFVANNMREGLVLLDNQSNILSMNTAARNIFGCNGLDVEGKSILVINRSIQMQNILNKVQEKSPAEETLTLGNKQYELYANPFGEDELAGSVLFIVNIDSKREAERLRKEFSANVSHELKTPLTSISGYAEIMRDGMVDPEDITDFSSRIHEEATRLISLVDDIMELSRLDENNITYEKECVDLLSLCREIADRLKPVADQKQVAVSVRGDAQHVSGVRRILDEMIFNLMDNAIKYNRPNGTVDVSVLKERDQVVLRIADTGVGIPNEHQHKVFERFYRVDQSHSKDTGGTGLGLAIVKHSALFHDAGLTLESQENQGTTLTISFQSE